ncbi:MAG: 6-bladed beta-propeller [bacterium]
MVKMRLFLIFSLIFLTTTVFASTNFIGSVGIKGKGPPEAELLYPYGVAVSYDGSIYVADTGNDKIKKYDKNGKFLYAFGQEGTGEGQFRAPQGIAVDKRGNIFVVDTGNERVQHLYDDGNSISFVKCFTGNPQFYYPRDIELDKDSNLYVLDSGNDRVLKFDSSFNPVNSFNGDNILGSEGSGTTQFSEPYGLTLDKEGNIYVADMRNERVSIFDKEGNFIRKFGIQGRQVGEFLDPVDVAVDSDGNIWVADKYNFRIQKFSNTGQFLHTFGRFGPGKGQFHTAQKLAIHQKKLYVVDSNNSNLQIFDISSYITNVSAYPYIFSPNDDNQKDTTTITYHLPEEAKVTIKIYNTNHELVRDLIVEVNKPSGTNTEIWDGKDNSNIVVEDDEYTYKIDAVNIMNYHAPQQRDKVIVDNTPPEITNPKAIPGVVPVGATVTLSSKVIDKYGIVEVMVDIAPIGGAGSQAMSYIGNDIYSYQAIVSEVNPGIKELLITGIDNGYNKSTQTLILKVGTPTITILPDSGTVGSVVTVHGEDFFASELIRIDFGTTVSITSSYADATGSFSSIFTIDTMSFGIKTICAVGLSSEVTLRGTFSIKGSIVLISPVIGTIGTIVSIEGVGFEVSEEIVIDFGTTKTIATGVTNLSGVFKIPFTVDSQPIGSKTVRVRGISSNQIIEFTIFVAYEYPILDWTGEENYEQDGLHPEEGERLVGTYTYRVKYIDYLDRPPLTGYPEVRIFRGGRELQNSPFIMEEVNPQDIDYKDGKLYSFEIANLETGLYSYQFVSKNIDEILAKGSPTISHSGPKIIGSPTLTWIGEGGYISDGVEPDVGPTGYFTYKVLYTDIDNIPPAEGYPRVYVCLGGFLISDGYTLIKENGNNYAEGVVYSTNKVRFSYASEAYSYYFEVKNEQGVIGTGTPTVSKDGPIVEGTNLAPLLFMPDEKDYIDGLEPNRGTPGTTFTFRTAYRDINIDPPASGYPALLIYKDGAPYGEGTYSMNFVNGNYLKGATFTISIVLDEVGIYQYKFYAKDSKGEEARGPFFILLQTGPKISHAPELEWRGTPGYEKDGLEPHEGIARETYFTFKVKYKDEDNAPPYSDYPKICILKGTTTIGEAEMRVEPTKDYIEGENYWCVFKLQSGGVYSYYFEAKDEYGIEAIGTPTNISYGPIVIGPGITLVSPVSGFVGTKVTIAGEGYYPTEPIQIDFGTTKTILITTSDAYGKFIATFIVDTQAIGPVDITATSVKYGHNATGIFNIIEKPADGSGIAKIEPDRTIVDITEVFYITYTAEADLSNGTVTLTIPPNWTIPPDWAITVTPGPEVILKYRSIVGSTVIIPIEEMFAEGTFTIMYIGTPQGTITLGTNTFIIKSEGEGGILTPITNQPVVCVEEVINPPYLRQLTTDTCNESPAGYSPDGKMIVYARQSEDDSYTIWIMDADGKNKKEIIKDEEYHCTPLGFLPDGEMLVYSKYLKTHQIGPEEGIYIIKNFKEVINGTPPDEIRVVGTQGLASVSSPDANVMTFSCWNIEYPIADIKAVINLQDVINHDTTPIIKDILVGPEWDVTGGWSPDGKVLSFYSTRSGDPEAWMIKNIQDVLFKNAQPELLQLTNFKEYDCDGVFSPDGEKYAFTSTKDNHPGRWNCWVITNIKDVIYKGAELELEHLIPSLITEGVCSWSPDGTKILIGSYRAGNWDVWEMDYPYDKKAAPATNIISPILNQVLKGKSIIKGTAKDNVSVNNTVLSTLLSYTGEYSLGTNSDYWIPIVTSNTQVDNGTLAIWDVSDLENGLYTIKLTTTDGEDEGVEEVVIRVINSKITLISPDSGVIGTVITVEGKDFVASELIRIDFGTTKTINIVTCSAGGTFSITFPIDTQYFGTKTIMATGVTSGLVAKGKFSIIGQLTKVYPHNPCVGTPVTIEGNGFGKNEMIRIDFGTIHSITTIISNPAGTFSSVFTARYSVSGIVTITAIGLSSNQIDTIKINFLSNMYQLTTSAMDLSSCLSPDGTQIVFHSFRTWPSSIWIMDSDGNNQRQLNVGKESCYNPRFSPDGSYLAFQSERDIWLVTNIQDVIATGTSPELIQIDAGGFENDPGWWSPDNKMLSFYSDYDVWVASNIDEIINEGANPELHQITNTDDALELGICWSPDGKWLAYAKNEDLDWYFGNWEICIITNIQEVIYNNATPTTLQITYNPAFDIPVGFSPDGKKLAFLSTTGWPPRFPKINNISKELMKERIPPAGFPYDAWIINNIEEVVNNGKEAELVQLTNIDTDGIYAIGYFSLSPDGTKLLLNYERTHDSSNICIMDYPDKDVPAANIISPILDQQLKGKAEIIGLAKDNVSVNKEVILSKLSYYSLKYRQENVESKGSTDWNTIITSNTPVELGTLTPWDTTTIPNGIYTLKLIATDGEDENVEEVKVKIANTKITLITPIRGSVGSIVSIEGANFNASEGIRVDFGTTLSIATTISNSLGNFELILTVDIQPYGSTSIIAIGLSSNKTAMEKFFILPQITQFTPTLGSIGTIVTIRGNGHGVSEEILVAFGQTKSIATTYSNSVGAFSINFTVNTQSAGTKTIVVRGNSSGVKTIAYFYITIGTLEPKITLVSPVSGSVGAKITVTGEGYETIEPIIINFGISSTITLTTSSILGTFTAMFTIDTQIYGSTSIVAKGLISNVSTSSCIFITGNITLITPTSGTLGTTITVSGNGFGARERIVIDFGNISTIIVCSSTSIGTFLTYFTATAQSYGTTTVTIQAISNQVFMNYFFVLPKISSILPTTGTIGSIITIRGDGFAGSELIRIDFGTTKSITNVVANNVGYFKATFTIDTQIYGSTTIRVIGTNSSNPVLSYFFIQPNITLVSPKKGTIGTIVTLSGNGYRTYQSIKIRFGTTAIIQLTSTDITGSFSTTFTIDTKTYAEISIIAYENEEISALSRFQTQPNITLISPKEGTIGSIVTLAGNGYVAFQRIRIEFGTIPSIQLTSTSVNGTFTTTFTINTQAYGKTTIVAVQDWLNIKSKGIFTIKSNITLLTPTKGTIGTEVTIFGNGFGKSELIQIDFGATSTIATEESDIMGRFISSFRIDTQPYGSTSICAIGLKTGSSATISFFIKPKIIAITPTSASVGTIVEIKGLGYSSGKMVRIDFGKTLTIVTTTVMSSGLLRTTFTIDTQNYGTTTIVTLGVGKEEVDKTTFIILGNITYISPILGTVGSIVNIEGNGFGSNDIICIDFGTSMTIELTTASYVGTFSTQFMVDLQPYGDKTIVVRSIEVNYIDKDINSFFILPNIKITPTSGEIDSIVTVKGNGYYSSELIWIDFGTTKTISDAKTDTYGSFTTFFRLDTQAYGMKTIVVRSESGLILTTCFYIKDGMLWTSPVSGTVGTMITIRGIGYGANEFIRIDFGTIQTIATAVSNESGIFAVSFTTNLQPYGTTSIIVTGLTSMVSKTDIFFIKPKINSIFPTSGSVGIVVTLQGDGYSSNAELRIDFGMTKSIVTTYTESNGSFKVTFTVDTQPQGTTTVITAINKDQIDKAEFIISGNIVYLSPTSGTVGCIVTIAGNGFGARDTIVIDFGITSSIAITTASSLGTFCTTFSIDIQPFGPKKIIVKSIKAGCVDKAIFTVLPEIILNPTSSSIGSIVTISGTGYFASELIEIDFGLTSSITFTTSYANGTFKTIFTVDTQSAGSKTVIARSKWLSTKVYFCIKGTIIWISPTSGTVGSKVEVKGIGYKANEQIRIDFGTTGTIAACISMEAGSFSVTFTVDTQSAGTTTILVRGIESNEVCISYFVITEDTIPPIILHEFIPSAPAGLPMEVVATITDNVKVNEAILYWKIGGTKTISFTQMVNIGDDLYKGTIAASNVTMRGLLYAIWATDGKNDTLSTIWTTITYGTVSSGKIGAIYPTYKSISVPVHPGNPDPAGVLWNWGNFEQNVRLVYFDGNNWVIHNPPDSTVPNFAPEIGYGITADKDNEIIVYGSSTNPSGYYVIPLKGGLPERWNHIGHPYLYPVALNEQVKFRKGVEVVDPVTAYVNGWIKSSLWYYDGTGFKMVPYPGVIRPWIGYFIPVTVDCEMLVPAEEIGGKHTPDPSQEGKSFCPIEEWVVNNEVRSESEVDEFNPLEHKDGWAIHLSVKAGSLTDRFNFAGVSPEASDTYDDGYDIAEIPMLPVEEGEFAPAYLKCYFISPTEGEYGSDYRSEVETNKEWKFRVEQVGEPGKVEISWDITTVPLQYYLYLKDRDNLIDMRKKESYSGNVGEYSLIVSSGPIKEVSALDSVAESYCYPNPAKGKKVFFVVPQNTRVSLKIFNIAGELVYEKEEDSGGDGIVEWDCHNSAGERVASGIYIYFIRDDKSSKTGKLAVMR